VTLTQAAGCGGRRIRLALCFLAALALAVSGCVPKLSIEWSPMPEEIRLVEGVPGYVQDRYQCGPSALASVIGYWRGRGLSSAYADADTIGRDIYSKSARGVLGMDLLFYAQDLGFEAMQTKGGIEELRKLIDDETPAIILVDYGAGSYQINHFMVAFGYSDEGFVVHSGTGVRHITEKELQRIWERAGYWTLVVKPW